MKFVFKSVTAAFAAALMSAASAGPLDSPAPGALAGPEGGAGSGRGSATPPFPMPAVTGYTPASATPAPTRSPRIEQVAAAPAQPSRPAQSIITERAEPRLSTAVPPLTPMQSQSSFGSSSPTPLALNQQEILALAVARRAMEGGSATLAPIESQNGGIRYLYGSGTPTIVCAVFQVCELELQRGERVTGVHPGDSVRWSIEPSISGTGQLEIEHVIIKPLDVDLQTTLIVNTNRRTYRMRLRSHRTEYMSYVGFIYPEEAAAKWDAIAKRETTERKELVMPETGETITDLNFDYRMDGQTPWKPLRVWNDGKKTTIQMPPSMAQGDAPTLMLLKKDGSFFTDEETALVNYRLRGDKFIVDAVFDKAVLIAGIGNSQERITITRGK